VNLPESVRLQGKQQVFLQAKSEPPAAIQAKQHAFARALMQQLHCAAVAELTAIQGSASASVHPLALHCLPGAATTCLGFVLRCAS
jgi:hypothetical protein